MAKLLTWTGRSWRRSRWWSISLASLVTYLRLHAVDNGVERVEIRNHKVRLVDLRERMPNYKLLYFIRQ